VSAHAQIPPESNLSASCEDCLVCISPARGVVASMNELRAPLHDIATSTGIAVKEIEKHLSACVLAPDPANDGTTVVSDQELTALIDHAVETFHTATLQNNLVASTAALSVRLRGLAEKSRRAQARSEQKTDFENADPRRPDTWPPSLRKFVQVFCDGLIEQATEHKVSGRKSRAKGQVSA
jgi:uncharacterized protein YdaT